jgi:hypothetical protein
MYIVTPQDKEVFNEHAMERPSSIARFGSAGPRARHGFSDRTGGGARHRPVYFVGQQVSLAVGMYDIAPATVFKKPSP